MEVQAADYLRKHVARTGRAANLRRDSDKGHTHVGRTDV